MGLENDLIKVKNCIIDGDEDTIQEIVGDLLKINADPMRILNEAVVPGLNVVSKNLAEGTMFIPDLILAGEAAKAATSLIAPKLASGLSGSKGSGTILLGVVEGDTHDIGKNIVKAMLIGAGFSVIDSGVNVSPRQFIDNINEYKPDVVGASAYTSATSVEIGKLNTALIDAGVRDKIKLIIGGAGVYRDDIARYGADAFGYDALEAVQVCKRLVRK